MVKLLCPLVAAAALWRLVQWYKTIGDVDWSLPFEGAVMEEWRSWTPSD